MCDRDGWLVGLIIQRDRSTALYGSTHSVELPYFRSSLIDPEQRLCLAGQF